MVEGIDVAAGSGVNVGACVGYVARIGDVMAEEPAVLGWGACSSENIEISQLKDVVERWLERHPEKRHMGAAGLVADAFAEAFPCE